MSASVPLHTDRRRASSFGDDAEQYDRVRPPYPGALVDALLAGGAHTVLDVGCGTGIATRLFTARGCLVLGLEPDPRMAAVARRRGLHVEGGTFEEWPAGGRQFDLLVAGQAWHWVDPHRGAAKAAEVLRAGGTIGLFWNQSFPEPPAADALQEVYERLAPELGRRSVLLGLRSDELYETVADALRASGSFVSVRIDVFEHSVRYPTEAWLELTTTHSDHRTLPGDQLDGLLSGLRVAVSACGGEVAVRYETTLVSGRRADHGIGPVGPTDG